MLETVKNTARSIFGLGDDNAPQSGLPDRLTPHDFIALSDKLKPMNFKDKIQVALRYYRGIAQEDTLRALRLAFPKTADYMTPVSVPIIEYIVNKQARVFAGEPSFELLAPDGTKVEKTSSGIEWKHVLTHAELQRHLQQTNRLTRLCKRCFVRVTWDPKCSRLQLVTFTPDRVHILFPADSTDLNDARGVLFEIGAALVGTKLVKRWEFWSAGENPQNFIIDETGKLYGIPDDEGNISFANPYTDEDGNPIVPIVSFGDEDVSEGYWLLPRQSLVDAQKAIDVDQTNLKHISRLQGYGQWVSEVQPGEHNADNWSGEPTRGQNVPSDERTGLLALFGRNFSRRGDGDATIAMGPDVILEAPRGRTMKLVTAIAQIADQLEAGDRYLKQMLTVESVPPGEMIGEPQRLSGYALKVERLALTELRADQIALYQRPVHELLSLIRNIWNAHQDTDADRFGKDLKPRFSPDDDSGPIDPQVEIQVDQFRLQNRLASRAQIISERDGISLDDAQAVVAQIDAERPASLSAAQVASVLTSRPTPREQSKADTANKSEGDTTEPPQMQPKPQTYAVG